MKLRKLCKNIIIFLAQLKLKKGIKLIFLRYSFSLLITMLLITNVNISIWKICPGLFRYSCGMNFVHIMAIKFSHILSGSRVKAFHVRHEINIELNLLWRQSDMYCGLCLSSLLIWFSGTRLTYSQKECYMCCLDNQILI